MTTDEKLKVLELAGWLLKDHLTSPQGKQTKEFECKYFTSQPLKYFWQYGYKSKGDLEPFSGFVDRAYQCYLEGNK